MIWFAVFSKIIDLITSANFSKKKKKIISQPFGINIKI